MLQVKNQTKNLFKYKHIIVIEGAFQTPVLLPLSFVDICVKDHKEGNIL